MKTIKKLALTATLVLALANGVCSYGANSKSKQRHTDLIEEISSELEKISKVDSLMNAPIIVAPEVTYNTYQENDEGGDLVVTILGLTIPFLFAFGIVWLILWTKKNKFQEKCKIIDKAIEMNYQLPDSFYSDRNYMGYPVDEEKEENSTKNSRPRFVVDSKKLQTALLWIAFGLTGVFFFGYVGAHPLAILCLLAVFVGIAKLVTIYLTNRSYGRNDRID